MGSNFSCPANPSKRLMCIRSHGPNSEIGSVFGHSDLLLIEEFDKYHTTYTTFSTEPDDEIEGALKKNKHLEHKENLVKNHPMDQERNFPYVHCKEINEDQFQKLQAIYEKGRDWSVFGADGVCSTFASEAFYDVTGEKLSADSMYFDMDRPKNLNDSIMEANGGKPSNYDGAISVFKATEWDDEKWDDEMIPF